MCAFFDAGTVAPATKAPKTSKKSVKQVKKSKKGRLQHRNKLPINALTMSATAKKSAFMSRKGTATEIESAGARLRCPAQKLLPLFRAAAHNGKRPRPFGPGTCAACSGLPPQSGR